MSSAPPVDFAAITGRQQGVWSKGDFNVLALQVVPVSEALIEALDPHAGHRLLDVACGSGNAALAAARRYCEVSGIDYVPALIERARQRAAADGTNIELEVGDAQALPFADGTFDVVTSVFGVMFAPNQMKAASELVRVCRPGGKIGLAAWSPESVGGEFFKTIAGHVPPPSGLHPPVRWGTEGGLDELLGASTKASRFERRTFSQYFCSIEHAVDVYRQYFGPLRHAFDVVAESRHEALTDDVAALFERFNRATDGTVKLECEYTLAIVVRR